MKWIKRAVPHLTLVLALMTLTFFCIDRVNTGMAFMTSELSKWVFAALAAAALLTSILLVAANWREDDRAKRKRLRARTRGEAARPSLDPNDANLQERQ